MSTDGLVDTNMQRHCAARRAHELYASRCDTAAFRSAPTLYGPVG